MLNDTCRVKRGLYARKLQATACVLTGLQEYAVILKFPVFPEFLAVSSDYMQLLAAFNFGPRMALAADVYVNFLRPCL